MAKYYHLTTKDKVKNILKKGLKPSIGEKSKIAGETEPAIYLSDKDSIAYWAIILGYDTILEVDCEVDRDFNYGLYKEYLSYNSIPPERISKSSVYVSHLEYYIAMQKICINYLSDISLYCSNCAYYYGRPQYNTKELHDRINHQAKALLFVVNNLNYPLVLTKENIINEIQNLGESGAYTICDVYCNSGKRLYQMLIEYPDDDLAEDRKKIYDYICKTFDGCLEVNTGGFC